MFGTPAKKELYAIVIIINYLHPCNNERLHKKLLGQMLLMLK